MPLPAAILACLPAPVIPGCGLIVDLRALLGIDHAQEKTLDCSAVAGCRFRQCSGDAAGLGRCQRKRKVAALRRGIKLALAPVARALHLNDVACVYQPLQPPCYALLGDLEYVEKLVNGET